MTSTLSDHRSMVRCRRVEVREGLKAITIISKSVDGSDSQYPARQGTCGNDIVSSDPKRITRS